MIRQKFKYNFSYIDDNVNRKVNASILLLFGTLQVNVITLFVDADVLFKNTDYYIKNMS